MLLIGGSIEFYIFYGTDDVIKWGRGDGQSAQARHNRLNAAVDVTYRWCRLQRGLLQDAV